MKNIAILIGLIVLTSGCLASPAQREWCQELEQSFSEAGQVCECSATLDQPDVDPSSADKITPQCNCRCLTQNGTEVTYHVAKAKPRQT